MTHNAVNHAIISHIGVSNAPIVNHVTQKTVHKLATPDMRNGRIASRDPQTITTAHNAHAMTDIVVASRGFSFAQTCIYQTKSDISCTTLVANGLKVFPIVSHREFNQSCRFDTDHKRDLLCACISPANCHHSLVTLLIACAT